MSLEEKFESKAKKYFDIIDVNGDNQLTFQELKEAFRKLGIDEDNAKNIFKLFDANSDGIISFKDWHQTLKQVFTNNNKTVIQENLDAFNNFFDKEKMKKFVTLWLTLEESKGITPEVMDTDDNVPQFLEIPIPQNVLKASKPTEKNILGPYYRASAPFRAKITPPFEPGPPLLVRGRVWGFDTKKPVPGATLDIWQANAEGRYDNDDKNNPPKPGVFLNRARVFTDETGYYEYETIIPGRYQIGKDLWRPAHIHYRVYHPNGCYKPLVTQLYFKGDPYNEKDQFIRPSLIMEVAEVKMFGKKVSIGKFDVVLEPDPSKSKSQRKKLFFF